MDNIKNCVTKKVRPVKVLQFGEGNFLRAFADYLIDCANETADFNAGVAIIEPRGGEMMPAFKEQDCVYTVCLRGREDGKEKTEYRIITSVMDAIDYVNNFDAYLSYVHSEDLRFIISNTTEAGIVYDASDRFDFCPPKSFPGKITKLLYERCVHFDYDVSKGLILLPVELIDDNGIMLKKHVCQLAKDWELGDRFLAWINEACVFASTLVDRIVTGYPKDEAVSICEKLGYEDKLLDTAEPFGLWVIESDRPIAHELPLPSEHVIFTDNQKPYKQRKVRILNGAHTSFSLAAYLAGHDYVIETMGDDLFVKYIKDTMFEEIIPTLTLPKDDLIFFANAVLDRFANPFIKHSLLAISLNSVSKWRARCMPTLLDSFRDSQVLPKHLTFSLAALIAFDCGTINAEGKLIGMRGADSYEIKDDPEVIEFFAAYAQKDADVLVDAFLKNEQFWGRDLTEVPGLAAATVENLSLIRKGGMRAALETLFGGDK